MSATAKSAADLKPLRRAAAKARRTELAASQARAELTEALKATRRKGFTVRELADAIEMSSTATHVLLNRESDLSLRPRAGETPTEVIDRVTRAAKRKP